MVENKIAVDRNHQALKRILASLVAMAGWTATGGTFLRACSGAGNATTLPRHLHVAILRLLRPAEAATRRLVIVLSRGISVTLPPQRAAKPKLGPVFLKDGKGTGIVDTGISLYRLGLANVLPPLPPKPAASPTRPIAFPLLDPLAQSLPPPPPHKAEHRRATLPARLHRAECHSGATPVAPRSHRRHASRSAPCCTCLGAGRHAGPGGALCALASPNRQVERNDAPAVIGSSIFPGQISPHLAAAAGPPARRPPVPLRSSRQAAAQDPRGRRGSGPRPCDGPLRSGAAARPIHRHFMTGTS